MKRYISLALFILFTQGTFSQQAIVKSWEGSLNVMDKGLKVIFNITQNDDGKLTATMDSPDQNAFGIPVSNVNFENGTLKVESSAVGGSFEGKVNDSYTQIDGEWTQNGQSLPLILKPVDEEKTIEAKKDEELNFFSLWQGKDGREVFSKR